MQQHARVQNKPKLITVYNYSVQNSHLSPEMLEYFLSLESYESILSSEMSKVLKSLKVLQVLISPKIFYVEKVKNYFDL